MPPIERNNFLKFNPRNDLTFTRWKPLLSRFLIQRQSHCGAISANLSVSKKEEKRSEFHGRFFRGRDEIDWDACYACCNRFPDDIALRAIIRSCTIISREIVAASCATNQPTYRSIFLSRSARAIFSETQFSSATNCFRKNRWISGWTCDLIFLNSLMLLTRLVNRYFFLKKYRCVIDGRIFSFNQACEIGIQGTHLQRKNTRNLHLIIEQRNKIKNES